MRRRTFAAVAVAVAGLMLVALLILWVMRFHIATRIVDRKLADAHVPGSYRLTRIGPFHERLEDVRIGDPQAPDLVAQLIDVEFGYGWSGPAVRAIRAAHVRLRARLDQRGLSLGAIDRLMPKGRGGQTELPGLFVSLSDVELALTTPNGAIRARIEGAGNPQTEFNGTAAITAGNLRLASCALEGVMANFSVAAVKGKPRAAGPLRIAKSNCPGMVLDAGTARMTLSADKLLEAISLQATLDGFGGRAGAARFASITGLVEASERIGNLTAAASLAVRSFAVPDLARRVGQSGTILAGTPVSHIGQRAAGAFARLLAKSDARVDLVAAFRGTRADIRIPRVELAASSGERIGMTERGGVTWTAQGWRADADVTTGGGAMPAIALEVRQAAPGKVLTGTARLSDYAAGTAKLAAMPIRFQWNGARLAFDTILRIDGPIADGIVQGLTLPVRGIANTSGALAVDQGCQPVSFQRLRLSSFTFDAAHLAICGRPIVARSGNQLRIEAATGPLRLTGHAGGGEPVVLRAAKLRVTQSGFSAANAEGAIGPSGRQTHFAVAVLDGRFDARGIGGAFGGASAGIANVPLNIAEASGTWSFSAGLLHLGGRLRVSDAAAAVRFNPLSTDDALLDLNGGAIHAAATLRQPTTRAEVAKVRIDHDLSSGAGHASLDVPGITFTPKGLQPEMLTPLTLGVIANVAGTVSGNGRIDWGANGVISSGTFGTDRIDLAAAFGPVAGIKGRVYFTDLLGLVSAPDQEASIAEINPGVQVTNGIVHYRLTGQSRVRVNDAIWPFAGGTLRLEPTILDFGAEAERHLTFRIEGLDAAAFVQQLDFPNIAATGTFDGVLPMIFDQTGGRIGAGSIVARKQGGTLAYVGELSNAQLGTMGKLAFDALKAIRYSSLDISLDGRLDGEMVSRVRFTGVREATPEQSLVTRLIRNLPFRFNIQIRAPFRGLVGSARAYMDPRLLLNQAQPSPAASAAATSAEPGVQAKESGPVR